jgi:hypothetical protein
MDGNSATRAIRKAMKEKINSGQLSWDNEYINPPILGISANARDEQRESLSYNPAILSTRGTR